MTHGCEEFYSDITYHIFCYG